jgi:hypothetical protein
MWPLTYCILFGPLVSVMLVEMVVYVSIIGSLDFANPDVVLTPFLPRKSLLFFPEGAAHLEILALVVLDYILDLLEFEILPPLKEFHRTVYLP